MKKKLLLLICALFLVSGCDMFKDDFSDRYVYTTLYPLEFATNYLYSEYSNVESVYPNGADQSFEVTDKKIATNIMRLLNNLEEHDDVQNVYSNFDISDEIMAEIDA